MSKTESISIVEVGPRDGLQNVKEHLSFDQKKSLIQTLLNAGFTDVEAGSFVRADKIPAMADSPQIADHFKNERANLWYLAPNLKGLQAALTHPVSQIAFFTAASEGFNQKNIGMSVAKGVEVIRECVTYLKDQGYQFVSDWNQKPSQEKELKLRLYVSTVIACPYDGRIAPKATADIIDALMPLGFAQVSLGDTIGVGVPKDWKDLFKALDPQLAAQNQVALHCHDTCGTAISCIGAGLDLGVRTFDASIGGLGGCPFAPGATGNVATEDVLYFLENQGFKTPVPVSELLNIFSNDRTGSLTNHSRARNALSKKKN